MFFLLDDPCFRSTEKTLTGTFCGRQLETLGGGKGLRYWGQHGRLLKGGVLLWETNSIPVVQKPGVAKCTWHPLAMQGVDGASAELEPPTSTCRVGEEIPSSVSVLTPLPVCIPDQLGINRKSLREQGGALCRKEGTTGRWVEKGG